MNFSDILERVLQEDTRYQGSVEAADVPEYLYHGTYRVLMPKIEQEGLSHINTERTYAFSEAGVVYLARIYDEAESFAESSDEVPEEWLDDIVVLKILVSTLDISKLEYDSNIIVPTGELPNSFIYRDTIPITSIENKE